jgi:predicted nucleic acid-binding protein
MAFVLDASVAIASVTFEPIASERLAVIAAVLDDSSAVVPATFMPEILNVLVKAERRTRGRSTTFDLQLHSVRELGVTVDSMTAVYLESRALPLARTHRLSIFDATYLELAMRLSLPLATFDNGLIRAAQAEQVSLLP